VSSGQPSLQLINSFSYAPKFFLGSLIPTLRKLLEVFFGPPL
jgi:hypothetical protein